jgi:hypothetical protein
MCLSCLDCAWMSPSCIWAKGRYHCCCGESRSSRTRTMKGNKGSRTKTQNTEQGQPKALFAIVDFSKVDPLYKCRSISFYREVGGLLHFREHPRVKRIKIECARLSSGNLRLGVHVIGASWCHAANRGAFLALITCACRGENPRPFGDPPFALALLITWNKNHTQVWTH